MDRKYYHRLYMKMKLLSLITEYTCLALKQLEEAFIVCIKFFVQSRYLMQGRRGHYLKNLQQNRLDKSRSRFQNKKQLLHLDFSRSLFLLYCQDHIQKKVWQNFGGKIYFKLLKLWYFTNQKRITNSCCLL